VIRSFLVTASVEMFGCGTPSTPILRYRQYFLVEHDYEAGENAKSVCSALVSKANSTRIFRFLNIVDFRTKETLVYFRQTNQWSTSGLETPITDSIFVWGRPITELLACHWILAPGPAGCSLKAWSLGVEVGGMRRMNAHRVCGWFRYLVGLTTHLGNPPPSHQRMGLPSIKRFLNVCLKM